jgi:hypothetical protein
MLGRQEMQISTLVEVRFVRLLEGVSGKHPGIDRWLHLMDSWLRFRQFWCEQ